jgi:hypothetical protein
MTDPVDKGNIASAPTGQLNAAAKRYAASQGWALSNGSYTVRPASMNGRSDLAAAVKMVGLGKASTATVRTHLRKRAKAIGATDLLPGS